MKISNNALSFLLAQYRAIFKRAYVKGLASAVILTAGLAAGAAQAATVIDGGDDWAGAIDKTITSDNNATINDGYFKNLDIVDSTVNISGGTYVTKRMTVDAGSTVNILTSVYGYSGSTTAGDPNVADFSSYGTVNIGRPDNPDTKDNDESYAVSAQYNDVVLQSGSVTTINAQTSKYYSQDNKPSFTNTSNLYGGMGVGGGLTVAEGATVNVTDYGHLGVESDNAATEDGELMSINGTVNLTAGQADGSAAIRAVDNLRNKVSDSVKPENSTHASVALGSTGVINVNSGAGVSAILSAETAIAGTINVASGANFYLDGDITPKGVEKSLSEAINDTTNRFGAGQFNMTAGAINIANGATMTLGDGKYSGNASDTDIDESTLVTTFNLNGGTIDNAGVFVTEGALNLAGGNLNNTGVLDIKAGSLVNANEQVSETAGTDGIQNLGGTVNIGGQLNVAAGTTLVVADDATLTTNQVSSQSNGMLSVSSNGTLQVNSKTLLDYVKAGDPVDLDLGGAGEATPDKAGAVAWAGTIDFGDQVVLSDLTFVDENAVNAGSGGIWVNSLPAFNPLAKAQTVVVKKALGEHAGNLSIDAGTLDINLDTQTASDAVNTADGELNFKTATVHSALQLNATKQQELKLGNVYHLDAYTSSTDDFGVTTYAPAEGTISGINGKIVGEGKLNVNAGYWTASNQITVANDDGIVVQVQDQSEAAEHDYNTDSRLTLANGLTFDNASGDVSVEVKNSSTTQGDTRPAAELDLTAGVHVTSATNTATITASGSNATVYMNAADVNNVLAEGTNTNNLNRISLDLQAGGAVDVNGAVSANFDDFTSGAAASGTVSFSNGGVFVAESLTLTGDTSDDSTIGGTTIDIGSGTLRADVVNLVDDRDVVTDKDGNDLTQVTLASGNVEVGSTLNSSAHNLNVNGGALVFKTATENEQGLITSLDNIVVGADGIGSVQVEAGDWVAQTTSFDLQNGSLIVGGLADSDADGIKDNASLRANRLTVGETGSITVNGNGDATFLTLDASNAASGNITVANGTLTITGQAGDMNPSNDKTESGSGENHHGVYFGTNKDTNLFTVEGSSANLVFGTEASKTFYDATAQEDATEGSVVVADTSKDKILVRDGGRVTMDFSAQAFTKAQIKSLKDQLFNGNFDSNKLLDGFFDIGDSRISGIDVVNGEISWDNLADITDIVWDTTNTELGTAVVTDVTENSQIGGSYGALRPDAGTTLVHLVSNTELGNATANGGNFIGTAPTYDEDGNLVTSGTAVDAVVHEGSVFSVTGTGNLADVSLMGSTSADDLTTLAANTASGDTITIGAVTGGSNGNTLFSTAGEGTVNIGSITNVGEVNLIGTTNNISGAFTANNAAFLGATVNSKDVTLGGDLTVNASNVVIDGDLKFTSNHLVAAVQQGANVKVGSLTAANGGFIRVGSAEFTAAEYEEIAAEYGSPIADRYINTVNETDTNTASSGVLEVSGETRLNGATLFVDPEYNMSSSIVSLNTFGGADTTAGQLGTLDGSVVVGKNGIVGVGFESAAELEAAIAQYRDANGSLSAGDVGSIFYVNGQLNVANGEQIILNGNASHDTVEEIKAEFAAETNAVANADMYLGTNTALIVSDGALDAASRANENHDAAIEFESAEAKIYAQTGAKVLIDGTSFSLRSMNLFDDAGSDGVALTTEDGKGITLESVNGLFSTVLEDGTAVGNNVQMTLQEGNLARLGDLSDPVRAAVIELATASVEIVPPTEGGATTPPAEGEGGAGAEGGAQGGESTRATAGTTNRYNVASGTFLGTALTESITGSELEQASRLAVYAGTAQAVLSASNTTIDAVAGRMGMGAQQGNITFANNSQGAGLWLAPVYKNHDSDSFDAQGVDYGVDMDLYGVALGADYTLANGVRVGAMFNVGSGDADGQGVGEGVSNDFDYYGFAVYGGYSFGQLSVLADVSYTVADNEFDANTSFVSGNYGKISGTADSTLWSVGVTAQYALDFNGVEIAPHAGLRYSNLEVDSYQVQSSGQNVANFDTDSMSIFSIPVGVSISSDIAAGSWTIKPAVDLTLTANVGDDELDGTTTWYDTDAGYGDLSFTSSAEVLDTFTYGATVGISAQTGGFSLGLGLNYTGASNANEYGVQANARFVF